MEEVHIKGKMYWLYTSNDLRKILGLKVYTYKNWCDKGWIPKTPIYRRMKTNIKRKDENGNYTVPVEGKKRYFTEKMIVIIQAWYYAMKGKGKRARPKKNDIEMLHNEIERAYLEFKDTIEGKNIKKDNITIKDKFVEVIRSAKDLKFLNQKDANNFFYMEFFRAMKEVFDD